MAVIGSGPAGLAAADELNRCGHMVTVYERDEGPGGMMRFGVPDAKLEKRVIDRRVEILAAEGIEFVYDVDVGRTISATEIKDAHDAVVVAIGSRVSARPRRPRARAAAGSTSRWTTSTSATGGWPRRRAGRSRDPEPGREITAAGKKVIVVGGGDTGMDCISNSHREGARTVVMLDVYMALPPDGRDPRHPWPLPPKRTLDDVCARRGRQAPLGHRGHGVRRQGRRTSATCTPGRSPAPPRAT